jgi:hypothetical protein
LRRSTASTAPAGRCFFGQGGKDTDKEGSGLKNTVDLLEIPNADSAETDLDNEAIQWAGLWAALKILDE